jgi:hypothetical protein
VKCFIESRRGSGASDPEREGSSDSSPGLTGLPASLLFRHGALVLNPGGAVTIPGSHPPRPTVYRARTLMVPGSLEPGLSLDAINRVLAGVGMRLVLPSRPRPDQASAAGKPEPTWLRVSRPAVLRPAKALDGRPALPVVIDAWIALQALRLAADHAESRLDSELVRQIGLEHLLIGAPITGTPITEGGSITGGPITEGGGVTGPTTTDSYLYNGGDGRAPVEVCMEAPARASAAECATQYGRRPVVAVLDTGVRTHRWLGVHADPAAAGGYACSGPDSFVTTSQVMQDVILSEEIAAANAGDGGRQLIHYPWDRPVTAEPLVGELDTHTGHATFIAGIFRQVVPDAQVLSLRLMHSDGIVYEGDLTCALALLVDQVQAAQAGDMAQMVDVVSLSLGYFDESAADVHYSSGLLQLIDQLRAMGVVVVAAAGNYATSRRFYPAAFATTPVPPGEIPVLSVGALNPDTSRALFSDAGHWVNAWASGAALISTFPEDINGARTPEVSLPGRESFDPDNFTGGGFASWSGTSFAAPLLAAHLIRSLLRQAAEQGSNLRLDVAGAAAALERALAAFTQLGW